MHRSEPGGQEDLHGRVFVRDHGDGVWSVWLDERLLLVTREESAALRAACAATLREGGLPRPLAVLSGPACRAMSEEMLRLIGDGAEGAATRSLAAG